MSSLHTIHDFIGVGIGPFNLSLACLSAPITGLNALFLDRNPGFDWHRGLMFDAAHLQTPFLSDLVTLADPTHPLSFLNYLKQQGRLYSFYIRENFFMLRREYNRYCQWAAAQLGNLRWNTEVVQIRFDAAAGCYVLSTRKDGAAGPDYRARRLVLGTGPAPHLPACCVRLADQAADRVLHASAYLPRREALKALPSVTVVGGGQSAAEIFHDLLQDIDHHHYRLNWITRSPRFLPLEYTKLTLEMTSPEYVRYFHHLPAATRDALIASQGNLYKGINGALINAIFDLLYEKRLVFDERGERFEQRVHLFTNSELQEAIPAGRQFRLTLAQQEQGQTYGLMTDGLVLATGYRYSPPDFLAGIAARIRLDADGRFAVSEDYAIDHAGCEIFVQNAELHTHGFVTPDLGMACYRNSRILKAITGIEHYRIEERIAFQTFGTPAPAPVEVLPIARGALG